MTLISLPTCLSMCLAAGWIIAVLYGPNFSAAHVPLAILAWCGIPVALGVARSSWLTAERAWGFQLTAGAIGLIANFILNLLFIPLWGAAGAAVATLISYVIIVIPVSLLLRDGGRTCSAMIKGLLLIPVPRTGR